MTVKLSDVTFRYGRTRALDDLSINIEPGSLVAVLGLNGAGKTTLLKALAGTLKFNKGNLYFDDVAFRRDQLEVRRSMMFVPDNPELFFGETLLRNLSLFVTHYDLLNVPEIEQMVLDEMEAVDLLDKIDSLVDSLSRGQRYKFGLVLLRVLRLKLWILDEPFASGMDAPGIRRFRESAQELVDRGGTVVYSTQMVDLAEGFSNRICVIDKGKIIADTESGSLAIQAENQPALQKLLGKIEGHQEQE